LETIRQIRNGVAAMARGRPRERQKSARRFVARVRAESVFEQAAGFEVAALLEGGHSLLGGGIGGQEREGGQQ
jgi:hypothetical protein